MPASKKVQKKRWEKIDAKARRKKKKKRVTLTDKQRSAWASAHYIVHHGSTQEAEKLLRSKMAANLSAEMVSQLKAMIDPC